MHGLVIIPRMVQWNKDICRTSVIFAVSHTGVIWSILVDVPKLHADMVVFCRRDLNILGFWNPEVSITSALWILRHGCAHLEC